MVRFRRIFRCEVCGTKLPNGERLNCDRCEDWAWKITTQARGNTTQARPASPKTLADAILARLDQVLR